MSLRRVGWAVAALSAGLGLAAPLVLRSLSPEKAVVASLLHSRSALREEDVGVDPWGRPYCWRQEGDDCVVEGIAYSRGPDGVDDDTGGDDVRCPIEASSWWTSASWYASWRDPLDQILAWSRELLLALGAAIAWALAGPWSRASPRAPSLAREVLLAMLLAAPFAGIGCATWLLIARAEDASAIAPLQLVPASVAVCGSISVAALLAALAWRLGARRSDPAAPL